ncbi:MAG: oxidoreductase [Planctomyces sp.]|jgi:NAD(P)H-quinone oxidoreductase subunit 5|nr:oxidoreductase [Planctomyces sp.]
MIDPVELLAYLATAIIAAPLLLVLILGSLAIIGTIPSERCTTRLVQGLIGISFLATVAATGIMILYGIPRKSVILSDWIILGHDYHFVLKILLDPLSIVFALLTFVLCTTIGSFVSRYMHKEPGFYRFFVLFAIFVLGMLAASLADTIETLFFGWELVGLSSALLIAFFQERPAPARSALWVWVIYRFADAALLLAAVTLHHMTGEGDFDRLLGTASWPSSSGIPHTGSASFLVGLLLIVAAAGKSGLVPFSGWLPRAMEGPTPSSAVFYGALSVHLGVFLLLRMGPFLSESWGLTIIVLVIGISTAFFASLASSVQTDIKSVLAFASLAQVGLIVTEIGCGLRWLPLFHLVGHACLRTLQFLRAPSMLQDHQKIENAIGGTGPGSLSGWFPARYAPWIYRLAFDRGSLDDMLWKGICRPVISLLEWFNRLDEQWMRFLGGEDAPDDLPITRITADTLNAAISSAPSFDDTRQ